MTDPLEVLPEDVWRPRRERHQARVRPWVAGRLQRRRVGAKDPVDDFLFEYYPFRPGQLLQWHPGFGVALTGESAHHQLELRHYERTGSGVTVALETLDRRRDRLGKIRDLLVATTGRPAAYGCFALHEWAMVYRLEPEAVRHATWPLRLRPEEIARTVEGLGLRCTHFDAFRFFTPEAEPLNTTRPTRAQQAEDEQPGCLHATMDLYKWAMQLQPLISSELVADTFELAREVRTLDMRAAPYDLTALGVEPLPIESTEGRMEFVAHQRAFAARGAALRHRLLGAVNRLLALEAVTA